VRIVALNAGFACDLRMGLDGTHVFFLVAVEAKLARFLEQQSSFIGLVGTVASGALAVGRGIVLEGSLGHGLL